MTLASGCFVADGLQHGVVRRVFQVEYSMERRIERARINVRHVNLQVPEVSAPVAFR